MATTTKTRKTATPEAGVKQFDATKMVEMMEQLTARVAAAESENDILKQQLNDAKINGEFTDEFGQTVKILDRNMLGVNAGMHDKPGTINETLDVMERMAKIRREKFDRERTRKILMHEEVEDNAIICDRCGRSEVKWIDNPSLFDEHIDWHINGKQRAYRGRKNIRRVDEEDNEDAERTLFEKLVKKYGVVREEDTALTLDEGGKKAVAAAK